MRVGSKIYLILIFSILMSSCSLLKLPGKIIKAPLNLKRSITKKSDSKSNQFEKFIRNLSSEGYSFSKNPDLIVSIDTKSKENVYINRYNDYNYYGWYYPYYGYGSGTYKPFTKVVGLLYIDIVDSKTGKLIWQGNGSGSLSSNKLSRDQLISNFVSQVMESYPPSLN